MLGFAFRDKPEILLTIASHRLQNAVSKHQLDKVTRSSNKQEHIRAAQVASALILRGGDAYDECIDLLASHRNLKLNDVPEVAAVYLETWLMTRREVVSTHFDNGVTGRIGRTAIIGTVGRKSGNILVDSALPQYDPKFYLGTTWNDVRQTTFRPEKHDLTGVKGVVTWATESITDDVFYSTIPLASPQKAEIKAAIQVQRLLMTMDALMEHAPLQPIGKFYG